MARTRSSNRDLLRTLQATVVPIAIFSDQRVLVFCNQACAEWVGVAADELIGLRGDYGSDSEVSIEQAAVGRLCPPPEAFVGQLTKSSISAKNESQSPVQRSVTCIALGNDAVDCAGVFVIADDLDTDTPDIEPSDPLKHAQYLHREVQRFRGQHVSHYDPDRLIGNSPAMCRVRQQVQLAAGANFPTLIVGPEGSGREHIARMIHYAELQDAAGPLVPLECDLLDAELLQSTITTFARRCTELESEHPGAILLLGIDKLPEDSQGELVGFLSLNLPVRLIATAKQSLLELSKGGNYRRDVAYALSTLVLEVPSLADRQADIPRLAQLLLEECNCQGGEQRGGFSPEALDQLASYHWPGDVAQMAEAIREAHQNSEGTLITPGDLPKVLRLAREASAVSKVVPEVISLDDVLADAERRLIGIALERSKGNKSQAAEMLGISRARIHRRIEQLGLD